MEWQRRLLRLQGVGGGVRGLIESGGSGWRSLSNVFLADVSALRFLTISVDAKLRWSAYRSR